MGERTGSGHGGVSTCMEETWTSAAEEDAEAEAKEEDTEAGGRGSESAIPTCSARSFRFLCVGRCCVEKCCVERVYDKQKQYPV